MSEQYKTDALIRETADRLGLTAKITHKDWPADGITDVELRTPGGAKHRVLIYEGQTPEQVERTLRDGASCLTGGS